MSATDPHEGQPVVTGGAPLTQAAGAMILVHGRGSSAGEIIGLGRILKRDDVALLAPAAAGHTWYPYSFMMPTADNEPYLTSAKATLARLVADIEAKGIPAERIALTGFSQGACLSLEFAARNPRRYGAVLALSGGLIGDRIEPSSYTGSLAGTPVFIGCSDIDMHVPLARVQESVAVMRQLGGEVTERIYPNAPHAIVPDEVTHIRRIVEGMLASPA